MTSLVFTRGFVGDLSAVREQVKRIRYVRVLKKKDRTIQYLAILIGAGLIIGTSAYYIGTLTKEYGLPPTSGEKGVFVIPANGMYVLQPSLLSQNTLGFSQVYASRHPLSGDFWFRASVYTFDPSLIVSYESVNITFHISRFSYWKPNMTPGMPPFDDPTLHLPFTLSLYVVTGEWSKISWDRVKYKNVAVDRNAIWSYNSTNPLLPPEEGSLSINSPGDEGLEDFPTPADDRFQEPPRDRVGDIEAIMLGEVGDIGPTEGNITISLGNLNNGLWNVSRGFLLSIVAPWETPFQMFLDRPVAISLTIDDASLTFYGAIIIPEFPAVLVPVLLMLLAVAIGRRRASSRTSPDSGTSLDRGCAKTTL